MFVCVGEKEREENRESYTRYRGYAVLSSLNGRPTGSKQQRHISRQSGPSVNVERRASGEREKELRSVDSDRLCLSVTFLSFFLSIARLSVENRLKYLNGNGPNHSENSSFFSFVSRSSFHSQLAGPNLHDILGNYRQHQTQNDHPQSKDQTVPIYGILNPHVCNTHSHNSRDPKVRKRVDWCRQFVYPQKPCLRGMPPSLPAWERSLASNRL